MTSSVSLIGTPCRRHLPWTGSGPGSARRASVTVPAEAAAQVARNSPDAAGSYDCLINPEEAGMPWRRLIAALPVLISVQAHAALNVGASAPDFTAEATLGGKA